MKKRFTFMKTLLVAVGLGMGASAWADTETLTLYSQDYQDALDASSWVSSDAAIPVSLETVDENKFIRAGWTTNSRYAYTNFFANGTAAASTFYGEYTTYTLSFDAVLTGASRQPSDFAVMANGHIMPYSVGMNYLQGKNYAAQKNPYLFYLKNAVPTAGDNTESVRQTFYINETDNTVVLPNDGWCTYIFDVTATTVSYTIKNKSTSAVLATGSYTIPDGQSNLAQGLFTFLHKQLNNTSYAGRLDIDNIKVTTEVEAGFIETPTAAITAVNGIYRTVTFSCITDGVTLSYSTDGGSSFTDGSSVVISANTSIIVKATKGGNSVQSEALAFEAGTEETLNTPSASVSALTLNADGLYYPTVTGVYNPDGVLLAPSATLTAKFNGSAVSLPYAATSAGTLVITASYDGYTSAEYNYDVKGYAKVLWQDYTALASLDGVPAGIRKFSAVSHFELAAGYGIKGIREGSAAWLQIDRAGMIAYDKLSEASEEAVTTTVIVTNNDNTGNNSPQSFAYGTVLSKLYYFTEGCSVTVSDAGYATYVNSEKAMDFSATSIEAYKVKVNSKGVATMIKLEKIPANTPVLLYKEGGLTEGIPVAESAAAVSDNDLVAGTGVGVATVDGDYTNMILNNVGGNVGFYFAAGQTVAANRAYLHILTTLAPDKAAGSRMTMVFGEGETTGINAVESTKSIDGIYNLNGQRVAQPTRGLYIVNGKKVVVK